MIDQRTEHLINRKLDGELTEAESLELDKLLIRAPEARDLLEQYRDMDELTADSLNAALSQSGLTRQSPTPWAKAKFPKSQRWLVRASAFTALAASIALAVFIFKFMPDRQQVQPDPGPIVEVTADSPTNTSEPPKLADTAKMEKLRPVEVLYGPRRQEDRLLRDLFGVYDPNTNSVYFLEADQMQKTAIPVSADY